MKACTNSRGRSPVSRVGWNLLTLDADIIAETFDVDISPYRKAVLVTGVRTGTPAHKAEVRLGDLIIAIEGQRVRNAGDICKALDSSSPGDSLTVTEAYEGSGGWQLVDLEMKLR